jgi:hypothetical protein
VLTIRTDEPRAVAVVDAIHTGAVEALRRLLHDTPGLATARVIGPSGGEGVCESGRSPGRCCTWWRIGRHTSRGSETVAVLVAAGADVNARFASAQADGHAEAALHWAASSGG